MDKQLKLTIKFDTEGGEHLNGFISLSIRGIKRLSDEIRKQTDVSQSSFSLKKLKNQRFDYSKTIRQEMAAKIK